MKLPFTKLHPDAKTPTRAHEDDAGLDLYAASKDFDGCNFRYGTGIAIAVPQGYVGLCLMRSSVRDTCLSLANAVGIIDSGYIGEIVFTYRRIAPTSYQLSTLTPEETVMFGKDYAIGDKIGQLVIVPIPDVEIVEFDSLPDTERGTKGHGSSGK